MLNEVPRQRIDEPRTLSRIGEALRGLEHGKLTVVVQDGLVVQLERTEKVRLPKQAPQP